MYIYIICFLEYVNNLQGQKRPERVQHDSYFLFAPVCGHRGLAAEPLRGRKQPTMNK